MIPTSPVIPGADAIEQEVGKGQKEYLALPVFRTELASISRWKLSEDERAYIAAGGDLFIAQLNFGQQLYPIMPLALPEDEILTAVLTCEESLQRGSS